MKEDNPIVQIIKGYVLPIAIVLIGVLGMQALGTKKPGTRPPAEVRDVQVFVSPVEHHEGHLVLEADGVVVPFREIQLATQVSGRIAHKAATCRPGNSVKKGQELFRIDPIDFELEVKRLEQQVEQARLQLAEADIQIRNTTDLIELANQDVALQKREFDRLKKLEDGNVITATDVDRAERAVLTARNTLVQLSGQFATLNQSKYRLDAALTLAGVNLEKAQLDQQRASVRSPVDGVIIRELVEEDSFAQKGQALVVIEDTSNVEVKCNLQMDDLYWIWDQTSDISSEDDSNDEYRLPDTPVEVTYHLAGRGDSSYSWQGRLERYDGLGLDNETRMVPVRVVVPEPHRQRQPGDNGPSTLVRGMYVSIRIQARPRSPLVEIPESAVQPGNRVWRVSGSGSEGEGTLDRIDDVPLVRTVESGDQTRWIVDNSGGLFQAGQLIAVRPFLGAGPGDTVTFSLLADGSLSPPASSDDGSSKSSTEARGP